MFVKGYGIIEKASKLSEGEVEFIVSTNALDSYDERIDVGGIKLKDFKLNPVILWSHNSFELPIAKATKIWKSDGKLMAKALFDMSDPFPRKVYKKIVDGFLSAVSIGGTVDEWGTDGHTISKMTMKEFSVVSIPANQEALVTAKSMTSADKTELDQLANAFAAKTLQTDSSLTQSIETLDTLVATLKGLVIDETDGVKATNTRVVLRQAQAVDKQTESIIRSIKLKGTN